MPRDYRDEPDITVEPVPGLPEALPRGETVLWQGRPSTRALARSALSLRWVAGYFVLLAFWRVASLAADMGWAGAAPLALPFLGMGIAACAILLGIAYVQARATMYTITTERVAMRIGAALTLTLNIPLRKLDAADLALSKDGTGTIAMTTAEGTRLSYLVLWPHARPWHMRRVQPALRCIPDAENVARILADAAETRRERPEIATAVAIAAE